MTRIFVIVALTGLFHLLNFPAQVLAQTPNQLFEQTGNTVTGKNVVSLTTTDLLSSQDLAPRITDLPAKRSRIVNQVKGAKNSPPPPLLGDAAIKKMQASSLSSSFEIGAEMMVPAQRQASPPISAVSIGSNKEIRTLAAGNQQLELSPAGDRTTTIWNYENQPTLFRKPNGTRVTMVYNANNRRVSKE